MRPRTRHLVFGSAERIAGTVYGTIVVMATITAGAGSFEDDMWRLIAIVGATVLILWVAHVYAHGLGESVHLNRALDAAELKTVARREASIVLAAFAPLLALTLGALGVLRASTALWVAVWVGVATLAMQGLRYAQIEGLGRVGTAVAVGVNVLLGLAIVGVKAVLAH